MRYWWSTEYNSGVFFFWKKEDEESAVKAMKRFHAKPFDFGQTSENSWRGGRKVEKDS